MSKCKTRTVPAKTVNAAKSAAAVKTVPAAITASARRKTNAAMTAPAGANKLCRKDAGTFLFVPAVLLG